VDHANPDALDRVLRLFSGYGVLESQRSAFRHSLIDTVGGISILEAVPA
jgi:hypothetical protein